MISTLVATGILLTKGMVIIAVASIIGTIAIKE